MVEVFDVIPLRSVLMALFIPVHCTFRFVFPIYTQEIFELLIIQCLILSVGFWFGKSKISVSRILCHVYAGALPVLLINFIPEHIILDACSNFLIMMLMTVLEDNLKTLIFLITSNALAWTLFIFLRMSSELATFQETKVTLIQ